MTPMLHPSLQMWICLLMNKVNYVYVDNIDADLLVEYASYTSCVVHPEADPYEWWELNKLLYPKLYFVAQMMLIIKPSSSACERIFSKCARIMTKYRSAMEIDTLDACVFLDKNPFLFEQSLKLVSKKRKGFAKGSHQKKPTRESVHKIKTMKINWEYVFSDVIEDDSDVMEDDSDVELVEQQ